MEFSFPQRIRFGLGVAQQVGLACKEAGPRTMVVTESIFNGTKELAILTQGLDRAGVSWFIQEKLEEQNVTDFLQEAQRLGRNSYSESVVALGSPEILALGRYLALNMSTKGIRPFLELPTGYWNPFLLREDFILPEDFQVSRHPSPLGNLHQVFLDPHLQKGFSNHNVAQQIMAILFCSAEAYLSSDNSHAADSLLLGALEILIPLLNQNPLEITSLGFRTRALEAGLNMSLALALGPPRLGLCTLLALGGMTSVTSTAAASIFLPSFLQDLAPRAEQKMNRLLGLFGLEADPESRHLVLAQEVRRLVSLHELPSRLSALGLVEDEVPLAGETARSIGKGGLLHSDNLLDFLKEIY